MDMFGETVGAVNDGAATVSVKAEKFGDVGIDVDGAKFGDACEVVGTKFGVTKAVAGADGTPGGIEKLFIVGRKFGDVANESVRLDDAVAKKAFSSGDVEPIVGAVTSSMVVLGHTVSAPSST